MSALKYALAMLGAGGAIGMAGEAAASTTVLTNISWDSAPTDISLEGGPAQFYYGLGDELIGPKHIFGDFLGTHDGGYLGQTTFDNTMPGADEVFYAPDRVKTSFNFACGCEGDLSAQSSNPGFVMPTPYVHLAFNAGGNSYVGLAHFDEDANLTDITYDQVDHFVTGGVPEPASWALMIGGFGLAGAAVRNRRRQALSA